MKKKKAFAFFDVDETLINEKSMFTILHQIEEKLGDINAADIRHRMQQLAAHGAHRDEVNLAYYRELAGLARSDIRKVAADYMKQRLQNDDNAPFLIQPVAQQLNTLRSEGVMPVFLSGSASDYLATLALYLDVEHVLATELKTDRSGRYTGQIASQPVIGKGKKQLVVRFLKQQRGDLDASYAFGDHISDLPFLELVGNPRVVSGDPQLEREARKQGWPVIEHPRLTAATAVETIQ